jgi:hypothetical protein
MKESKHKIYLGENMKLLVTLLFFVVSTATMAEISFENIKNNQGSVKITGDMAKTIYNSLNIQATQPSINLDDPTFVKQAFYINDKITDSKLEVVGIASYFLCEKNPSDEYSCFIGKDFVGLK